MPAKIKKTKESPTFDEYKAIKDEIIEISEQRFENILTRRLKEFKNSLMDELNIKFDSIDSKFSEKLSSLDSKFTAEFNSFDSKFTGKFNSLDSKISSLEKRMTFLTWFLPLFITILMITLKYFEQ